MKQLIKLQQIGTRLPKHIFRLPRRLLVQNVEEGVTDDAKGVPIVNFGQFASDFEPMEEVSY